MYLHVIHRTGEIVCIDLSNNPSWKQTKHLKYWKKKKHVQEAYLSHEQTPKQQEKR